MTKKHDKNQNKKWEQFAKEQDDLEATEDAETESAEPVQHDHAVTAMEISEENFHKLQNKIASLEMQTQQYKEQVLRGQAEMQNLSARSEREISKALKYGSEKLLNDLIPVIDSLTQGIESHAKDQNPQAQSLLQGMQMTLDLLQKTLEKHGVVIIKPAKGDAFDPQKHEAMTMIAVPNAESNSIVDVLQAGYELNGRIIRAARVVVAQ